MRHCMIQIRTNHLDSWKMILTWLTESGVVFFFFLPRLPVWINVSGIHPTCRRQGTGGVWPRDTCVEWRTIWSCRGAASICIPHSFLLSLSVLVQWEETISIFLYKGESVGKWCCFLRSLEALAGSILDLFSYREVKTWLPFSLAGVVLQSESAPWRLLCPHLQAGKGNWRWMICFLFWHSGHGHHQLLWHFRKSHKIQSDFIKLGNSSSGFLGLGQMAIKKHITHSQKILVILREICS